MVDHERSAKAVPVKEQRHAGLLGARRFDQQIDVVEQVLVAGRVTASATRVTMPAQVKRVNTQPMRIERLADMRVATGVLAQPVDQAYDRPAT